MDRYQTLFVVAVLLHPFLVSLLVIPAYNAVKFDPRLQGTVTAGTFRSVSLGAFRVGLVAVVYATMAGSVSFAITRTALAFPVLGYLCYRVEFHVRRRAGHASPVYGAGVGAGELWLLPVAAIEELLYRGALHPLVGTVGPAGFVVVSSVGFGVSHLKRPRFEVPYKTALGAVFCLCFLATGTLVAPVLAHLGYNLAYLESGSGSPSR